jgi:hypothetical protein
MNEIVNESNNRQKNIHKPSPRMDLFKLNSITNKFISISKEKERKPPEFKYERDVSNNSNNTNVAGNNTNNDRSKDIKKSIDASKSKISESLIKKTKPVLFKNLTKNMNSSKVPLKIANISSTGAIRNDNI